MNLSEPFIFACPVCRGALTWLSADVLRCPTDDLTFGCKDGIWHFLPPKRAAALAQFRQEYETIRQMEGRGSTDPAFYRALPFVGEGDPQISQIFSLRSLCPLRLKSDWAVRAQSFVLLLERVIKPLETGLKRPLTILDLGAGNGWLSHRLAERGHHLAAVDFGVNVWDGLGAHVHYENETSFYCLQAEFDHLPLEENQVDVVIFNASFHYSVNYEVTLREAGRALREGGMVVILDTAVYQLPHSGQQMVAEREATFSKRFGFASNALPSENFLTPARLDQLTAQLNLQWRTIDTVPTWRQWLRRLKVKLRRQREPAQFPIVIFTAESAENAAFWEGKKIPVANENIKDFADSTDFFLFSFSSVPSVARNSFWLFLARVGQQGVLLLFTALVARQLGEVGLGQLAWITAVLYIGNVFSTFGLDTALLRQIGAERDAESAPLASALGLELILAAIFIIVLWLLPLRGQTAVTVAGLRLYSWALFPLALLTITNAALRGYERMGLLTLLTLAAAVTQLGGTAVLFAIGGDFQALLRWLLAVQLLSAGGSWWVCRRWLPGFGIRWRQFRGGQLWQLARVGFWLALLMVTAVLLQRLGILLLGWLGTEAQMGQMAAALRLVEAARLLPGAVMGAMFPVLARRRVESGDWRLEARDWVGWGLVGYGLFAALALTFLARPLVLLLFGDGYETAVSLLQILAWGIIPFTISLPLSLELVVAGAEKWVLLATVLTLLGTSVLISVTFSWQGLLPGLALALLLGEWLLVVSMVMVKWLAYK